MFKYRFIDISIVILMIFHKIFHDISGIPKVFVDQVSNKELSHQINDAINHKNFQLLILNLLDQKISLHFKNTLFTIVFFFKKVINLCGFPFSLHSVTNITKKTHVFVSSLSFFPIIRASL